MSANLAAVWTVGIVVGGLTVSSVVHSVADAFGRKRGDEQEAQD